MWQALREELAPQGFELVTVGMDTLGAAGCRAAIEAANPSHPSLIDQHHVMADLFGVINIPNSIWIDEDGMIVRPAEAAPPPPLPGSAPPVMTDMPPETPTRLREMRAEAMKITTNAEAYHQALRDWVAKGKDSEFALDPEAVIQRSRPRNASQATGHAHFELATYFVTQGKRELAIKHFRAAHALVPDNWTFRRQAWSLEPVGDGPMARFWQGPRPEGDWPYEGDWVQDIRREGAENYYESWKP